MGMKLCTCIRMEECVILFNIYKCNILNCSAIFFITKNNTYVRARMQLKILITTVDNNNKFKKMYYYYYNDNNNNIKIIIKRDEPVVKLIIVYMLMPVVKWNEKKKKNMQCEKIFIRGKMNLIIIIIHVN
ncbi:hypothetical protein KQX54_004803 [Cotesia glomerata]|uniref:Uncharacterized protein n=1 Tax=Cotesia glomerata TaxID=32391 RepID=A0AAV7J6P6_COTGL|nr:hypothetical protein KQX54_004803 [Cotesia glomerata]